MLQPCIIKEAKQMLQPCIIKEAKQMLQPCIIKEAKQMLQPCIIKEAKQMLQPCIINPFTAMLSLLKLSTKVPNLKQLRPFSPFGKICIKIHSDDELTLNVLRCQLTY